MQKMQEDAKAKLLREAEARAEQIVRDAEAEAERIVKEAEAKWRERAEAERKRITSEAEREANTIISEALREARLLVSKEYEKAVEDVLREAYDSVRKRSFDIENSIRNLIRESLRLVNAPKKIVVSKGDLEAARRIVAELGLPGVVVEAGDIDGGVIVESESGIVVDNTYESRLREFQSKHMDEVRRILWG
ncbi:H+transporting two-sector ATPase E subunit [Desulfurococcus mucosus DSM 2162]|uniref:A-type ATP synthase subunit E n=2 Tax=Desulfurococcus mucosus TaxID=2275 RepID=E8RAJ3_DESM0|nr:H+transporting two-sector ATPase E subunit [Desulfurococcus mucosus DSM 2162]